MSANDVITQIIGCSKFFDAQASLLTGEAIKESKAAMCTSLQATIRNLPAIDTTTACTISTAIQNSKFDPEAKATLASIVQAKAVSSFGAVSMGKNAARAVQTIKLVLNYFTEDDWVKLQSSATISQKIIVVGDRLCSIGITNPSEASYKHVVALLACCSMPTADASTLHGLVTDMKTHMQNRRPTSASGVHLVTYPDNPQELPAELYAGAYSTSAPINKDDMLTIWRGLIQRIPLRTSNKQLNCGSAAASSDNTPNAIAMLLQHLLPAHMQQQQQQGELRGLVINSPLRPAAGKAFALQSPATSPGLAARLGHIDAEPQLLNQTEVQPQMQMAPKPLAIKDGQAAGAASGSIKHEDDAGVHASDKSASAEAPPEGTAAGSACAAGPKGPTMPTSNDDFLNQLEEIASGKYPAGKSKAIGCKRRSKGQTDGDDDGDDVEPCLKRPAASEDCMMKKPASDSSSARQLGCSKCRGSPSGCAQCMDVNFGGRRFRKA